jgi:hypothetical protein
VRLKLWGVFFPLLDPARPLYNPLKRKDNMETVMTSTSLESLPKIAEGKVRDLYEVDEKTLLFVASDRISAYDVIMENVPAPILYNCSS